MSWIIAIWFKIYSNYATYVTPSEKLRVEIWPHPIHFISGKFSASGRCCGGNVAVGALLTVKSLNRKWFFEALQWKKEPDPSQMEFCEEFSAFIFRLPTESEEEALWWFRSTVKTSPETSFKVWQIVGKSGNRKIYRELYCGTLNSLLSSKFPNAFRVLTHVRYRQSSFFVYWI